MAEKILYYNSYAVTQSASRQLPGMKIFSYFFSMYGTRVVPLDRTETIKVPIQTKSLYPIPVLKPFTKSFEEICNERAREILARAEARQSRLRVLWSGGIDSTLLLVSLLKNGSQGQRDTIVVMLTEESIAENPRFYRDHVRGKLTVEPANQFPYLLGGPDMFLGGEHNDQLFGSDAIGALILRFGPSIIHQTYTRDTFFTFFNEMTGNPQVTNFYLDLFERLKEAAPVPVNSCYEFLWWINFSLKWQCVSLRMLSYTAPRNAPKINLGYIGTNYLQFYNTEDFQLWSLTNRDKKIKDTWKTYKWPCKDIIYDYTKDADYRDNKTKKTSFNQLTPQHTAYNFIDEKGELQSELAAYEYYRPDNDFREPPELLQG